MTRNLSSVSCRFQFSRFHVFRCMSALMAMGPKQVHTAGGWVPEILGSVFFLNPSNVAFWNTRLTISCFTIAASEAIQPKNFQTTYNQNFGSGHCNGTNPHANQRVLWTSRFTRWCRLSATTENVFTQRIKVISDIGHAIGIDPCSNQSFSRSRC